jgi:hypothetical protein
MSDAATRMFNDLVLKSRVESKKPWTFITTGPFFDLRSSKYVHEVAASVT